MPTRYKYMDDNGQTRILRGVESQQVQGTTTLEDTMTEQRNNMFWDMLPPIGTVVQMSSPQAQPQACAG